MKIRVVNETFDSLIESNTSRIYQHITQDDTWAIISGYRDDAPESENRKSQAQLKANVKSLGYGFIESVARWVSGGVGYDEKSLLIPNITEKDAMKLGKGGEQKTIIIKTDAGVREICTTPFIDEGKRYSVGEIVRTYNITKDSPLNISDAEKIFDKKIANRGATKPIKGGKPFTLSRVDELYQPRPSYFQTSGTSMRIYDSSWK